MLKFIGAIRTVHVIAATMILAGLALMLIPSTTGVAPTLNDIYHMTPIFFGTLTLIGGMIIIGSPKPAIFVIATSPLVMYIAAAIIYLINHPTGNPAGLIYFVGYYLLMLRQYIIHYEAEHGRSK